MTHNLQKAFEPIHATDSLKRNTRTFVQQELLRRRHKARTPVRYALTCCAMFVVMACGFGGYYLYQVPVSYISVDVNPSVELALNRLDRVVQTAAFNDDGVQILQNLDLHNKPYTRAIELLLADKTFESYLSADALLSFTVVSDKEETLLAGIQQCQGFAGTNAVCHSGNEQLVAAAHHSGLSFGKYQAFLELSQYDSSITVEESKELSMRQLRDRINAHTHGGGQGNGRHSRGDGHHGCQGGRGE